MTVRARPPPVEGALLFLCLYACTAPGDSGDGGICVEAPVVTWETFGAGFLIENCQSCHATTAPDRRGAPDAIVFDTVDDAWSQKDRILARSAVDPPEMPPQGGTTADDRELLTLWLTCADEGT